MKKLMFIAAFFAAFAGMADEAVTTNELTVTKPMGKIRSKERVVIDLTNHTLGRGANTFDPDELPDDDYWMNCGEGTFKCGTQRIVETNELGEVVKISIKVPCMNRDGTPRLSPGGTTNHVATAFLMDDHGIEYATIFGDGLHGDKTKYSYWRMGHDYFISNIPLIYGNTTDAKYSAEEGEAVKGKLQGIPVSLPPSDSDHTLTNKENGTSIIVDRVWLKKLLYKMAEIKANGDGGEESSMKNDIDRALNEL